jgi:uncharacterized protein (DUF58 family)
MLDHIEHRLHILELKCRRPVEHVLAGEYLSVFRGRGLEFEDVRAYQHGDDVRAMDWKVTARTGEAHIKRYIEEREQVVYLLVDVSASMRHDNSGNKRETLNELCALITLAAIKNQDRVGLILFSDQIEQIIMPSKGRQHALRIIDELINFKPRNKKTDLANLLDRFRHLSRKYSIVFLISDFLTDSNTLELQALSSIHDLNTIQIFHPINKTSQARALIRIEDAETGQQQVIDSARQNTQRVVQQTQLREEMLKAGVNLMQIESGSDCVDALTAYLHERQRREIDETGG